MYRVPLFLPRIETNHVLGNTVLMSAKTAFLGMIIILKVWFNTNRALVSCEQVGFNRKE